MVCHVNFAGDPFCFGRTSAGINARRLVHSRSFSVERPVSFEATGVATNRRIVSSRSGTIPDLLGKRVPYPISRVKRAVGGREKSAFLRLIASIDPSMPPAQK